MSSSTAAIAAVVAGAWLGACGCTAADGAAILARSGTCNRAAAALVILSRRRRTAKLLMSMTDAPWVVFGSQGAWLHALASELMLLCSSCGCVSIGLRSSGVLRLQTCMVMPTHCLFWVNWISCECMKSATGTQWSNCRTKASTSAYLKRLKREEGRNAESGESLLVYTSCFQEIVATGPPFAAQHVEAWGRSTNALDQFFCTSASAAWVLRYTKVLTLPACCATARRGSSRCTHLDSTTCQSDKEQEKLLCCCNWRNTACVLCVRRSPHLWPVMLVL